MGNFTVPLPHRPLQTFLEWHWKKKKCITAAAFPLDQELCFQLVMFSHLDWKKVQTEFHSNNWVNIQHAPACTGEISTQKATERACRGNECVLVEPARGWMVGNRAHLQTTLEASYITLIFGSCSAQGCVPSCSAATGTWHSSVVGAQLITMFSILIKLNHL